MKDWDNRENRWYSSLEKELKMARVTRDAIIVLGVTGGVLLVTGIVLYVLGRQEHRQAVEAVPRPVTLVPIVGPGGPGLVLKGRF